MENPRKSSKFSHLAEQILQNVALVIFIQALQSANRWNQIRLQNDDQAIQEHKQDQRGLMILSQFFRKT